MLQKLLFSADSQTDSGKMVYLTFLNFELSLNMPHNVLQHYIDTTVEISKENMKHQHFMITNVLSSLANYYYSTAPSPESVLINTQLIFLWILQIHKFYENHILKKKYTFTFIK